MSCPVCNCTTFTVVLVNTDQMVVLHCARVGCEGFIEILGSPYHERLEILR